jgi:hypothetical protein
MGVNIYPSNYYSSINNKKLRRTVRQALISVKCKAQQMQMVFRIAAKLLINYIKVDRDPNDVGRPASTADSPVRAGSTYNEIHEISNSSGIFHSSLQPVCHNALQFATKTA